MGTSPLNQPYSAQRWSPSCRLTAHSPKSQEHGGPWVNTHFCDSTPLIALYLSVQSVQSRGHFSFMLGPVWHLRPEWKASCKYITQIASHHPTSFRSITLIPTDFSAHSNLLSIASLLSAISDSSWKLKLFRSMENLSSRHSRTRDDWLAKA
jgi:hypothetical protein